MSNIHICFALLSLLVSMSPGLAAEEAGKAVADPLPPGAVLRLGSTRLRPGGSVKLLAFSADNTKLASWSNVLYVGKSLCIWDVKSGRLLRRLDMPEAHVQALMWRPDGRGIALLQNGEAKWRGLDFTDEKADPKTAPVIGESVHMPDAPGGEPPADDGVDTCFAISSDGKTLAIGRSGKREDKLRPIRLRSLTNSVRGKELPAAKDLAQLPGNCELLLFTPNGKRLVAFAAAKKLAGNRVEDKQLVVVWDAASGKEVVRFSAPRPASNGRAVAAVSDGASPSVWRTALRACGI